MADDEASEKEPDAEASSEARAEASSEARAEASSEARAEAPPEASTEPVVSSAPEVAPSTGKTAAPTKTSTYRPSYVFLVVVTVVNLVADLWSKHWAKSHFESVKPGGSRQLVVIDDMMNLIFAKNRGGAWGLLQDETEALRRPFFLIVSVAAIVFIVSLYRKLQKGQTALKWGLPLVLGGALGNLVDRIRYGYVVDFIDIYGNLPEWVASLGMKPGLRHWPTFNVADISICVGVALMAIDMFTSRHHEPGKGADHKSEAKTTAAAAATAPSATTDASKGA
ncbi:MAG TPA: signal peptidase II [Polyangiaceae bacterium]|nr:signal peptidase II [Polyangiaceae bacterium]